MAEPAAFSEWSARRDSLGHELCSAARRVNGMVCSCYNGDEPPRCQDIIAAVDAALEAVGCRPPLPTPQEVELLNVMHEHYGFGLDRNDGRIRGRLGAWESCKRKGFVSSKTDRRTGKSTAFLTSLGNDALRYARQSNGGGNGG